MENNKTEKGVVRKVMDGLAESTCEAHKDIKTSFAAETKAFKYRHIEAITPRTFKERSAEIRESIKKYQPKNREAN